MSTAEGRFDVLPERAASPPIECVVFGWGANEDGQLGYDGEDSSVMPRVMEALLGTRMRGRTGGHSPLVAGSRNTMAISQVMNGSISCLHVYLYQDGTVWSWGWNERGTLGRETKRDIRSRPVIPFKNVFVVQAAIGGWHCLCIDDEGRVYAWGGNEYMQCGVDISNRDVLIPTHVVPHLRVQQVACGGMHSLALTEEGNIWTWGESWGDFSLTQDRTPRCVRQTTDTTMIACGAFHNMALDAHGHVYTWGINDYGQLGNGSTQYSTKPKRVVGLDDSVIVEVAAGGWHSVAVSKEGQLYVWGRGEYGRLGMGHASERSLLKPEKVPGLEEHHIVQASAGGTHTMCLSSEGLMFIWGRGSYGRLGNRDASTDIHHPQVVELPGGVHRWMVLDIACGGRHSLCLALPTQNTLRRSLYSVKELDDYEEQQTDDVHGQSKTIELNGNDRQGTISSPFNLEDAVDAVHDADDDDDD